MLQTLRAVRIWLIAGIVALPLQAQLTRLFHFTVTDPQNRYVTGLDRDFFQVTENGSQRQITDFSDVDSPITIAIVSESASQAIASLAGPQDVLIQTKSLSDALSQLAASTNPRKGLVVTTAAENPTIPDGVQFLRANASNLKLAVVKFRHQYVLQVQGVAPDSTVEVVVKQPRGFPALRTQLSPANPK